MHYGHCILGVVIALALLVAFGVSPSTLGFLAIVLACPLMMFLMMRMMMGQPDRTPEDHDTIRNDRTW